MKSKSNTFVHLANLNKLDTEALFSAATVLKSLASRLKDVDVGSLSEFLGKGDRFTLSTFLLPAMRTVLITTQMIFLGSANC